MKTDWRVDARRLLRNGFGVEDIAVKLKVRVDLVRLLVSALRASGGLDAVLQLQKNVVACQK